MTATLAMVNRLRRMVAEADTTTYEHADLTEIIERYPALDSEGLSQDDADWTATYDLNAAAAEIWAEKAAAVATGYDFSADSGTFSRSQQYNQAMRMARHYGARRRVGTITLVRETTDDELTDTDE